MKVRQPMRGGELRDAPDGHRIASSSNAGITAAARADHRRCAIAQRKLHELANAGPRALRQQAITEKFSGGQRLQRHAAPVRQLQAVTGRQTVQLFADDGEAAERGTDFLTVSEQEFALNAEITGLVQAYQANPAEDTGDAMMDGLRDRHAAIMQLHARLVAIVALYEAAGASQKTAFFNAYLHGRPPAFGGGAHASLGDGDLDHAQIQALFNSLAAKTVANNGDGGAPLVAERGRFLAFVMQGLRDSIGVDQYRNLDRNLGAGRRVRIGKVGPADLSGGVANDADLPRSKKTDEGAAGDDLGLWAAGGGSGLGYLDRKFANPYLRTANPDRGAIGDVQVNMDRDDLALPIFPGMQGHNMRLFSPPKKTSVHHEVGHLNSMLEGRSGGGRRMIPELGGLTDQEEMYNIWGGPRSDRAYGAELGLPERFNHSSLVGYFGEHSVQQRDFDSLIEQAREFTTPIPLPKIQQMVLAEVRRLLNGNWSSKTKGWRSKPAGVRELLALFTPRPPTLQAVRDSAATQLRRDSGDKRHPFTTAFYTALAAIDANDRNNLLDRYRVLKPMQL